MLKRIFPILAVVALLCCLLVIPASAAGGSIIDYKDHVIYSEVDTLGFKHEKFDIPKEYCAVMTIDKYGTQQLDPGVFYGNIVAPGNAGQHMSVSVYWPGGIINNVYIDASNLPNGASVSVDFQFTLSDVGYQTDIDCVSDINVQYFDSDYRFLGYQSARDYYWNIDDSQVNGEMTSALTLNKPSGTAYIGFYSCFSLDVVRSNDDEVVVEWWVGSPRFEAVTKYDSIGTEIPGVEDSGLLDDSVLWLRDVVDSFLNFEFAPGFSFNKVIYVVLVVGVLIWFMKVIS